MKWKADIPGRSVLFRREGKGIDGRGVVYWGKGPGWEEGCGESVHAGKEISNWLINLKNDKKLKI